MDEKNFEKIRRNFEAIKSNFFTKESENFLSTHGIETKVPIDTFISNIKQSSTKLKSLPDTFKISIDHEIEINKKDIIKAGKEKGILSIGLIEISKEIEQIFFVKIYKFLEFQDAVVVNIAKKEYLVSALIVRAMHELLAFFVHVNIEIEKKIENLRKQKKFDKMSAEIDRLKLFLSRAYRGSSGENSKYKKIHINDARSSLRGFTMENEKFVYNVLSELVHPNFLSNELYVAGALGRSQVGRKNQNTASDKIFPYLMNYVSYYSKEVVVQFEYSIEMFSEIKMFIDMMYDQKRKIEHGFELKNVKGAYPENGSSIEKAFDLTMITDVSLEQIRIQYQKLKELGLTTKLKTIHIEGDSFYDVHDTERGKVWFKISNPNNSRFNKKIIDNFD